MFQRIKEVLTVYWYYLILKLLAFFILNHKQFAEDVEYTSEIVKSSYEILKGELNDR